MTSHKTEREGFIRDLVGFLREYGLDGVDIDWEDPGARLRGGNQADRDNYVLLLAEIRQTFDSEGAGWEISIAVSSSYWYQRGFALESLQKHLDYFNFMSYDIYGMWDQDNEWTGPYLKGHTDWTMIDNGLDLLWRNGVTPDKVNMGFGFYGRSFTMSNPGCFEPNGVCQFSDGGVPGSCSGTKGVLTYEEVVSRNNSLDVKTIYEGKNTTVKYNVFGGSQWVSYDDGESFRHKLEHLASRCLGGLMIWTIDQDTNDFKAFGDLMGDYSHLQLQGLDANSAQELSDLFGQYNGQHCYATERCTKDGNDQKGADQLKGDCTVGWYQHICCPKKQMPKNCEWNGDPVRNVIGCTGRCGPGTFELNSDTAVDARGNQECHQGSRKLCCQSTKLFDDCFWDKRSQTPYADDDHPECPEGTEYVAWRNDKPDGSGMCQEEYVFPTSGQKGSTLKEPFRSSLCCPKGRGFGNCVWSNSQPTIINGHEQVKLREEVCLSRSCNNDKVQVAEALSPPPSTDARVETDRYNRYDCSMMSVPKRTDPCFPLCCDPPSLWNHDWPVGPEKLWEEHFSDRDKDKAVWSYDTQFTHNDKGPAMAAEVIDGSDAFSFMMLNGLQAAVDNTFHKTMTVVRRSADTPTAKREVFTTNQTLVGQVFEHAEETFYAYCNYSPGSAECENLFVGGAEDTIIRLPDHVGEGPFARVVSIERADESHKLPRHHLENRSLGGLEGNPVWKIKIDYAFHLARQDRGKVQIRVDYTTLLGYWKEITDSPATRRFKRNYGPIPSEPGFNIGHFRDMVARGETHDRKVGRRYEKMVKRSMSFSAEELMDEHISEIHRQAAGNVDSYGELDVNGGAPIERRWWGIFTNWLKKLTTVTKEEVGDLPLGWADTIKYLQSQVGLPCMQATYAYYLSATFIPPSKPDAFFYFGIEPTAYMELVLTGNAAARLGTGRKKIIDILAYPDLAIKGIAAVGPTMDVYGEIKGELSVHGKALAGCRVSLDKAQAYWPQDDKAVEEYDRILNLGLKEKEVPAGSKVAPTFEAGVALKAEIDLIVQPEANVGIKVGGGSYTGGAALVDAQISAYLFTALQFLATDTANTITKTFDYTYGVYLHWNVGYKARATVLEWAGWAMAPREAFKKPMVIDIYHRQGSIDISGGDGGNQRRMVKLAENPEQYVNETLALEALLDPGYLYKRQNSDDDSMDIDGPDAPSFSQPVTCPDGDSPSIQLPELRMNCGAFPRIMLATPNGRTGMMSSICDGITTVTLPATLTHAGALTDRDEDRKGTRRKEACKNNDPDKNTGLDSEQKSCETLNEFLYNDGVRKPKSYPNI
ncbi:chitinase [Madurella fahalii]|uniref:chitinase n=1 Tax=Madurella fahalii TaxID=1157608 RepID=A0ABQ0GIX2_9PEZI